MLWNLFKELKLKADINLKIKTFEGFIKLIFKINVVLANNKIQVQFVFVVIDTPIQADTCQYLGWSTVKN